MPQYRLLDLYQRFAKESVKLTGRFILASQWLDKPNGAIVCRYVREMCTLRLYDAWARFCRELVIVSASCKPAQSDGNVLGLAPGVKRRADVIPTLKAAYKNRLSGGEPPWGDPTLSIEAAKALGIQNFPSVSAGLGLTPSPVDNLRKVRNFIAHPSYQNAIEVREVARSLGSLEAFTAASLLAQRVPPGQTIFSRWAGELQTMALLSAR